ncbi:MAG: C4-dicarboxylate ABC transporter permease, partial [candidate division Zixibacteria bacterium]|nr:C4-dicarboxylate ABC transporter permease [candidate division Zixibacteria bacterium]
PGPELFKPENSRLVYALFASVFMYNIVMVGIGLLGNKLWVRLISAPKAVLYPVIIAVAFVGSYAVNNSMFDVYVCLGFGILGWVMRRHGFPTAPMVLAMILGRMAENNLRQALLANEWTIFFTNPLSLVLLILAVISLVYPLIQEKRKRKSIQK